MVDWWRRCRRRVLDEKKRMLKENEGQMDELKRMVEEVQEESRRKLEAMEKMLEDRKSVEHVGVGQATCVVGMAAFLTAI